MRIDARGPVWRFMGELADDTGETSNDERAARHDMRGPFETIETVIGECAAWRAEMLGERPTVAQARIMSRHSEAIGAMVDAWAANGRRPYQYRYDSAADVILWNIPEAATGWFVFDPDVPNAGAPWEGAVLSVATGADHGNAKRRGKRVARRLARAAGWPLRSRRTANPLRP